MLLSMLRLLAGDEKIPTGKAKKEEDADDNSEDEPGAAPMKERCNWIPQYLQGTYEDTVGVNMLR